MDVKLTLRPGAPGTKRLSEHFGERLVCVRYRYDRQRERRFKTVELIVDEQLWSEGPQWRRGRGAEFPEGPALVRVQYEEFDLRETMRACGARWRPKEKLWEVNVDAVRAFKLWPRVVRFEAREDR
ncbi:hypothetical protein [Alkalilimnicola sp. S0819]|uniref:hypothetical protein n=1 Tax=Alkalilimnicola sp. S0819 TaxID=2613922 RepID=UPI001262A8D8|nr:hypothetical protein [Alkalilimnicola sp. S0819]KAB7619725.1 hypothetical protein F3N43_12665 [Alkalilimnicola sp. S0819]MPQ17488.1 hypothetical protein [Alkalilimnicola sp. S0819]